MTAQPKPPEGRPYHHGALREAMLRVAERILQEEGIEGLTLRRAAREAGASHAAPKNHFGDLTGLLSELAAVGFRKISAAITEEAGEAGSASERRLSLGRGYLKFARENPALFLLMFRSHRLDHGNPILKEAVRGAFDALIVSVVGGSPDKERSEFSLSEAARITNAWAKVHGLAMLLIDGQLSGLRPAGYPDEEDLVEATLAFET